MPNNPYTDLLESGQTVNAETGGNPYLDLVGQDEAQQQGAVRAGATLSIDSNPDEVARQKRIAQSLNVPLAAVEADPAFATSEAKLRDIQQATANSPALQKKFTDADFAKLAHDDVHNLSAIEQALRLAKNAGGALASGIPKFDEGMWGVAQGGADLLSRYVTGPLAGTILPEDIGARMSDYFSRQRQASSTTAANWMPKSEGNVESGIYSGLQSLSQNLLTLPAAAITGNPELALAPMVGVTGGQAYGQARDKGIDVPQAMTFAASQAAIEYATEKLPVSWLLKDLKAGSSFLKTLGHQAISEVPGEQVATALQDLNEWAVLNPEKPFSSYLADRPDAAIQTLIATLVGTGGQVTTVKAIDSAISRMTGDGAKSQQAEQDAAQLDALNQLAAASKVLQRDPETFQSFVASASEDGPVSHVYIDGKTLMQSGMAEQAMKASPAVAAQLVNAAATGGQVSIPVDEYATRIAPTDIAPALLDHLKTDPEGFSRFEMQTHMAEAANDMQAEIERAIADSQNKDEFRASQERVKQTVLDNLNQVGRFSPQANEMKATAIAAYHGARGVQQGITPEESFAKHFLRVQGERAGGMQFDQGGITPTEQAMHEWSSAMSRVGKGDMNYVPKMAAPAVLRAMGERGAQISAPSRVIQQIGRDHPDVPLSALQRLPELLSDPLFVLPHHEGGVSVVLDAKTETGSLLVAGVRDGKLRTITPLDDVDGGRLASWIERAMVPGAKVYARNKEAIVKTMASTSAPDRANSVEALPRSGIHFITRESLVKRLGEDFYQDGTFDPTDPNILHQSAFHGSPYKFDKFSLEHMGNGEGAQAYGYGLYFASNRAIAEFYRQTLAPGDTSYSVDGKTQFSGTPQQSDPRESVIYAVANGADIAKIADQYEEQGADPAFVDGVRAAVEALSGKKIERVESQRGQLYEVNIPEDDEYLLWDKPLSEQPEKVRAAMTQYYEGSEKNISSMTGQDIYRDFAGGNIGGRNAELASKDLNRLGISGIKYLDGSSRDKGEGSFNYVIFDDSAIEILQTYYQPDGGASTPRGAYSPEANIITLLNNADLSTFLHEGAHYFFENDINLAAELAGKAELTAGEQKIVDDVSALLTWHGIQGDINSQLRSWYTMDFEEKRSHHERTAESFERYLLEGKAPSIELQSAFQTFRSWMISVYKSLKDFLNRNPEAGNLSDEVRGVFDRMLATDEQIALAEQGRSMMALFTEPLGMTPDEFAAYQAQGKDATATAMDELQAKGVRDMQWMGNKRGKAIAKLQREAKALRAEAMLEARREVMSQPVYRAWDFLTRKQTADDKLPPLERKSDPDILDPEIDSLFVAIAKMGGIKKDQVISEWGIDPKDIPQSGLFGKPVWRLTKGSTIDEMAQSLEHHGYLPVNEHGQYELNDLADRFMAELAGEPQYSHAKKYDDLRPGEQIANPGGLGAGKLDLGALMYMFAGQQPQGASGLEPGELGQGGMMRRAAPVDTATATGEDIIARIVALKMTAQDGLHPDMVAPLFDYSSGDEMVRALAGVPTPKEAIAAMTDQIMLQRHGELATPEAIATAADMAIHNEVRARFITTEANALAHAVGKPKLLAAAAKAFAAEQVARQKVRDLKPGLYTNAETKAAKGAEKAMKAGDTAQAAAEKRNQAINVYLARATYEAKDDVESGIRYLKKFDKPSKKIDPEYMDQIEAMMERFDLRAKSLKSIDKRASFAQWLASQREQGIEPDVPEGLENEANRTHYKNLSVEEFRGLIDTVKQIEHMGRLKNKLLTAQDQREFGAIVNEVSASIVENGGPERPVELEQPGRFKEFIENFRAGHRKLASLIRQMDGGKDNGPFWRVFVRGMNEAGTHEASMIEQATVRLAEIYQPMLALKGALNGDKRFIPAINASLTRAGRLSIALNWGNETNRLRVMEGDQWSEHQVQAILNTLTRSEWQFVQDTWAFIDSYWPQIEAKEKRVTGRAPDKVQALPFNVMVNGENVSLTGGYYPIKYDSNRDDRAEKHEAAQIAEEMKQGAYTRASTRRGHTKARTESVKRPIKKTLDVITQHVGEVTHDLAWHEWLIDANRLLDAKPINQAIRTHYGTAVVRTMKDALTGIAVGNMARQTTLDAALLYLRANVSRSTMGFSLTTALMQPFGLLQSVVRVGAKPVMHGIGRWAGDMSRMENTMTWVGDKSEFMRLRSKTFNRELNEIRNRVSKGHSKIRTVYDASLFMLMQKMQLVADIPTWIGVYDQAMANGMEESYAVAMADQSVLDSQGGGQNKDLSEIQRKQPLMTMFYSYFNTTLNLVEESTAKTNFRDPLAVAGWMSDMLLLMIIPALGPAMIVSLMRGEKCWEEGDCARELAQDQLGYTLGTVVGVRELSGMAQGYDYAGPPVGRVIADLGKFGKQVKQGEMDEAAALSAVHLFGTALGIPTTQIVRSYRGWQAWADGDAPPTSILMGPPPKN